MPYCRITSLIGAPIIWRNRFARYCLIVCENPMPDARGFLRWHECHYGNPTARLREAPLERSTVPSGGPSFERGLEHDTDDNAKQGEQYRRQPAAFLCVRHSAAVQFNCRFHQSLNLVRGQWLPR
jgi:hypothetical protein